MADAATGTPEATTGNPNVAGDTGLPPVTTPTGDTGNPSTATPQSAQTGESSGEQTGNEWLSEELRGNEALKGFKDANELAQAHLKHLENAKVPEKTDGYTLTIPDGVQVDNAFVDASKSWALKAGLTSAQYEAFAAEYIANQQAGEKAVMAAKEADTKALKLEWAGKYDENLASAVKVAEAFFGKEFGEQLAKDPILRMVKGFFNLSSKISEDSFTDGEGRPGTTRPTASTGEVRLKFPSMEGKK